MSSNFLKTLFVDQCVEVQKTFHTHFFKILINQGRTLCPTQIDRRRHLAYPFTRIYSYSLLFTSVYLNTSASSLSAVRYALLQPLPPYSSLLPHFTPFYSFIPGRVSLVSSQRETEAKMSEATPHPPPDTLQYTPHPTPNTRQPRPRHHTPDTTHHQGWEFAHFAQIK